MLNGARVRQGSIQNLLLRRLQPDDFAALASRLEPVQLRRGQVVVAADTPIEHCYFPQTGLASIISHGESGRRIEVGIFGCEGMASTSTLLGAGSTPMQTILQIDGEWLRAEASAVREAMQDRPAFRDLMLRYVQCLLVMSSSTALSNGSYTIEERLARWLLVCHDRVDGDDLPLTHDFLATMLAVRRSGVTLAIHILEGEGLIKATRGNIRVLDRSGLERLAGSSYGTAESEYERLIGPFTDKRVAASPAPPP